MFREPQYEEYLKYVRKHEKDPLIKEAFEILLYEIQNATQESNEFFPGLSNIVKAETLKTLHDLHREKTRNQVICVDTCWKLFTNFQKTRNFRAL